MRSEPVDVWEIDGRPGRFVWRERLYTVLAVIDRPPAAPSAAGERGIAPEPGHEDVGPAESDHDESGGHGPANGRWRCWKVLASPGKNVPGGTFRICQNVISGRWRLAREG